MSDHVMRAKMQVREVKRVSGMGNYNPKVHRRTKSHVKPNSAARRAAKIKAGKLRVVDGSLTGASA